MVEPEQPLVVTPVEELVQPLVVTPALSPAFTQELNPTFTQELNPTFTQELNPTFTQELNPALPPTFTQELNPALPKVTKSRRQTKKNVYPSEQVEYNPEIHGKACPRGTRRKGKWCVPHPKKPKPSLQYKLTPPDLAQNVISQRSLQTSLDKSITPPTLTEPIIEPPNQAKNDTNLNAFLKTREQLEASHPIDNHDFLYPDLNDPDFNLKIALKKEFADAQYDGKIHDIEKQANLLCSAKFELSPHQTFVRNFLSTQTPYNGLLLYHGLGTGKTCSAIGVAEEMRQYLKSVGLREKILVVASPNVQGNFKTQLFDDRKLMKYTNIANQNEYTWNIESCVGNTLLQEINPNSIRNLSREKLVSNVNALINESYSFMGYIQLANLITSVIGPNTKSKAEEAQNIRQFFNGRLIIIDEVHNIRLSEDNARKELQQVASLLMRVAKHAVGMRLLLLSATPMFNSYREIVWITNLLNMNDKRSTIQVSDVFDAEGVPTEEGEALLQRKLTGYVSYVRGENPYTFPFRVYPDVFAPEKALDSASYPTIQMNGAKIDAPIAKLQLYINRLAKTTFQSRAYFAMMEYMRKRTNGYYTTKGKFREMPSFENMESFGYIMLQKPIEALNVVYPSEAFDRMLELPSEEAKAAQWNDALFEEVVGKTGLANTMTFQTMHQGNPLKHDFDYRPEVLRKYGRIFSEDKVAAYSAKIAEILRIIRRSEGVVLIYSQFIDGGIIPIALALEEMGFVKHTSAPGAKPLFKRRPTEPIDAITLQPISKTDANAKMAKYIVITGDKGISPSNTEDVKYATSKENMDGSKVKVVLISKAGSEGLDFKYIRQVHAFDSWFNMNRLEQVIGRGVRNLSHCALPFKKRNVEIYLHATMFDGSSEEAADLYLYRLAEKKAVQIGRVSRILKETATDCMLHIGQTNFTVQKLAELAQNQQIKIQLSSRSEEEIPFQVGDKEGTEMCDYMTCAYQCRTSSGKSSTPVDAATADATNDSVQYATRNQSYITSRIKEIFRENHAYTLTEIVRQVNILSTYPIEQILFLLSRFVNNKSEYVFDRYGRFGYLIQRGKYYVFQPIEISDERISMYDRIRPVEWKRDKFAVEYPSTFRHLNNVPTSSTEATTQPVNVSQTTGEQVVLQIHNHIEDAKRTDLKVKSEDKDWYKNASKVLLLLKVEYGIPEERLLKYMVEHAIESLGLEEKLALLKHVHNKTVFTVDPVVETLAANYFNRWKMPANNGSVGIYLSDKESNYLYVYEPDNGWRRGEEVDMADFNTSKYDVDKRALNRVIGYMLNFKDQDMSFYYKDITLQRNRRGRRCDRSGGKAPIYETLNLLLGEKRYTQENTVAFFGGGLCVIAEILMRERQVVQTSGKIYLLTPEQAVKSNITNFSIAA
jgi:hypothetical protein